ncbi:MAG: hypothetical protein AAF492_03870, partial [Verrucomicrobiota bacterium]
PRIGAGWPKGAMKQIRGKLEKKNHRILASGRCLEDENDDAGYCVYTIAKGRDYVVLVSGEHAMGQPSQLVLTPGAWTHTKVTKRQPERLKIQWAGAEGPWFYRRDEMKAATGTTPPDVQKTTVPVGLDALIQHIAKVYEGGDAKTLEAAFHRPDAASRAIATQQSKAALVAPKLDRFKKRCAARFGVVETEQLFVQSMGLLQAEYIIERWPKPADTKNLTIESAGDVAVATHLDVVKNTKTRETLRIHTQFRMKRVQGRWYLTTTGWDIDLLQPDALKALSDFVGPALTMLENARSLRAFKKEIRPLLTELDRNVPF